MTYIELMMTEGDAIAYARLQADLATINRTLYKRPAEAKRLRHIANAKARELRDLERRYA